MNILDKTIHNLIVISYKICKKIKNDDPKLTSKMALGVILFADLCIMYGCIVETELLPIRSLSDFTIIILILCFAPLAQVTINMRYFKDKSLLAYYNNEAKLNPQLKKIDYIYFFAFLMHPLIIIIPTLIVFFL